jgi:formate dehydrogenase major subunit
VLVTDRIPPLRVRRRLVHQIGLPYHFAAVGLVRGDAANELIPFVADPNVSIQESKCLTGNIEPGRQSRGRRVVTSGPLLSTAPDDEEIPRDLPRVRGRPVGRHGLRATRAQESEEA